MQPVSLILIGFLLSILGFALPLMMMVHVVTSTLPLNFLAFGASVSGLAFGISGAASYIGKHRPK